MLNVPLAATAILVSGGRAHLVAPLVAVCLSLLVAVPLAAARSKLHMPGYIGIAIVTFLASLCFGAASGARSIAGSLPGVVLSMACFISIAVCMGSILALVFYREPPEA